LDISKSNLSYTKFGVFSKFYVYSNGDSVSDNVGTQFRRGSKHLTLTTTPTPLPSHLQWSYTQVLFNRGSGIRSLRLTYFTK